MSKIEELFDSLKSGAKLRKTWWNGFKYIQIKDEQLVDEDEQPIELSTLNEMLFGDADDWEISTQQIDWPRALKHNVLCWFWDKENPEFRSLGLLTGFFKETNRPFGKDHPGAGMLWYTNCKPVDPAEINFYLEPRK